MSIVFLFLVAELRRIDLEPGAHGGSDDAGLDILTLCCGRLCLYDSAEKGIKVFGKLFTAEADFADRAVNDVGLVETVFNLTGFCFGDSLCNIRGNGARLGVRHEAFRAEYLTQTTDHTHHVRGSNDHVEIKPVFVLDLLDVILCADVIRACLFGCLGFVALGENKGTDGFAGTVGKYNGAADLLVCMARVDT